MNTISKEQWKAFALKALERGEATIKLSGASFEEEESFKKSVINRKNRDKLLGPLFKRLKIYEVLDGESHTLYISMEKK